MKQKAVPVESKITAPRASIRQIAQRAQVSSVTVSNVLRGRAGRASADTRARVLEAARALNYVPVPQPSVQNRRIETHVIGLVSDDVDVDDYEGMGTYLGMRDGALTHGYDLLALLRVRHGWALDREEARFLDRRSDGYIFVAPHNRNSLLEMLVEHRIPVVACYSGDVPEGVAKILLDEEGAMHRAVEHLAELGHTRVGHIMGAADRFYFDQRRAGFSRAMAVAGLDAYADCILPRLDARGKQSEQAMREIEREKLTAVACANDDTALELWDLAEAHGLRVPRDLSITGMDNITDGAKRGLTSVAFSFADVGRLAVDTLVELLQGADPESSSKIVPVELVRRDSTMPPTS